MMQQKKHTILICAGGTGGHIIPGLTVAKALQAKNYHIEWLGTKAGLEVQLVTQAGINLNFISINGLRGKNLLTILLAPFKIIIALLQSILIIKKLRPKVVLGMGGFVSGPSCLAAWLCQIPMLIQEQNSIPGTTNRLLAKIADHIFTGFPNTFANYATAIYSGNPIRSEIANAKANLMLNTDAAVDQKPLKVLILGGSRGAAALNAIIPQTLADPNFINTLEIWHQCGAEHLEATLKQYQNIKCKAKVAAFIDDMAAAYTWADLVICRSGALTIAELTAVGVASILVPFPYAIDDHQTINAKYLSSHNAAILIPQAEFTVLTLANILAEFINKRSKLVELAANAKSLANLQAVDLIVAKILAAAPQTLPEGACPLDPTIIAANAKMPSEL